MHLTLNSSRFTLPDPNPHFPAVIWIRINCMRIRIHKIWWMRIRIQVNQIFNYLKVEKQKYFQICTRTYDISYLLFRFRLEKYNFLEKKIVGWSLLFSSFYTSESGSGSTDQNKCRSDRMRSQIRIHITALLNGSDEEYSVWWYLLDRHWWGSAWRCTWGRDGRSGWPSWPDRWAQGAGWSHTCPNTAKSACYWI